MSHMQHGCVHLLVRRGPLERTRHPPGEYVGFPPTGTEVEFTGISVYRIEAGKIAESWNVEDQLGLMQQIGAIPEPEQSEEATPT